MALCTLFLSKNMKNIKNTKSVFFSHVMSQTENTKNTYFETRYEGPKNAKNDVFENSMCVYVKIAKNSVILVFFRHWKTPSIVSCDPVLCF